MVEDNKCKAHSGFESEFVGIKQEIVSMKNDIQRSNEMMRKDMDDIKNRLPVWATVLIASLTGAIGWLVR